MAVAAGIVSWLVERRWELTLGHSSFWLRAGEVAVPIAAASLVYFGLAALVGASQMRDLLALVRARLKR
jgi:hypothetical protein